MTQEIILNYPFAEITLKYFQTLISWPGVILLLGLFIIALIILNINKIFNILSNIQSQKLNFSKDGISLEFTSKQQTDNIKEESNLLKNLKKEDVEKLNSNTSASENSVKKIETIDELEDYISKHPKEIIKEYIILLQNYDFEKIYNIIFGTQIRLVEFINEQANKKCTLDDIFLYYNQSKEKGLNTDYYNLDNYLNFLYSKKLILVNNISDNYNEYHII